MARYHYKKVYGWSPDLAYVTGLFSADGCLSKDGRHLILVSKDMQIIECVAAILGRNSTTQVKLGQLGTPAYQLQFSDVALYDFLTKVGLTPAKSQTMPALSIPDLYYRDFLRGNFDGDGSIYGGWDTRWKSSFTAYTSFCSGSIQFLKWIRATNSRLANTTRASLSFASGVGYLRYAKADSLKLFYFMYPSLKVPCLQRKLLRFIEYYEINAYTNEVLPGTMLAQIQEVSASGGMVDAAA